MQISEEKFLEFKKLMREHAGEEAYSKMTEEELWTSARALLNLVRIACEPFTKKDKEIK